MRVTKGKKKVVQYFIAIESIWKVSEVRITLQNGPQSSAEINTGLVSHLREKPHIVIYFFAPPWGATQN